MKKFLLLSLLLTLNLLPSMGQQNAKARDILDKTYQTYQQTACLNITFEGTQQGKILLQDDCFYLESNGIKSWFDGNTQWSYVGQNEEVTISVPTPEEIQSINPYALLGMYKKGFGYSYEGLKVRNGKEGYEIRLTPINPEEIADIFLIISTDFYPTYIEINMQSGDKQKIIVTSCKTEDKKPIETFRFHTADFPKAEIIDMR